MKSACTVALICLSAGLATGQTSIGYEDPDRLDNLLEYRLPDWGWRTWDLDGEFRGSGSRSSSTTSDGDLYESSQNSNDLRLVTDLDLYRESEQWTLFGSVDLTGNWARGHRSNTWDDASRRQVAGRYELRAAGDRYLGAGPWFVTGGVWASGSYDERREEYGDDEYVVIDKGHAHTADLGLGLGRIRDVTPLIRAERLSERLAALGRPRLTPTQVQHVARVLAQEFGYRIVFDRPDRRFWRDVLDPVLEGEPLSVAEIFYLTETPGR